jgi:hypothetical protein
MDEKQKENNNQATDTASQEKKQLPEMIPLELEKGGKKFVFSIEQGASLALSFDAAFDLLVYLRDMYKQQLKDAAEQAKKDTGDVEVVKQEDSN